MKRSGPSSFSESFGETLRQESHAFEDARMTLWEEHLRHWTPMVYALFCTTVECTSYHYVSGWSESGDGMLPQLSFCSWVR
eukprot:703915-Pyramimonas_sp.AAC.1